jgi:hypothetical protein
VRRTWVELRRKNSESFARTRLFGITHTNKYREAYRFSSPEGFVTLGYTAGYLLIGLEPIRLRTCVVQVPVGRREVVVVGTVDLTVLSIFIS